MPLSIFSVRLPSKQTGAEMPRNNDLHLPKTYYRPIEAAVRWAGLERFESQILSALGNRSHPTTDDFPRWPMLYVNTERILDGMRHGDLPFGRGVIACSDLSLIHDADVTVRHVDLRAWLIRYYPDQKPSFLFDQFERSLHPAICMENVQALMADREALQLRVAAFEEELACLRNVLKRQPQNDGPLGPRSETTYLNIIGAMQKLLLGTTPSGSPNSLFRTTDSLIEALVAHHSGLPGISERTLWTKLSAARKQIETASR
jgi:hypothetical protein